MKAVVWTAYGPPEVLRLEEVEKPAPRDNEVLIKIHATTATSGDCEQRGLKGAFWFAFPIRAYVGLRRPTRITRLGMELAGVVESVGKNVRHFKAGDPVFGATGFVAMGTYAEYICLPEQPEDGALALKPANMTNVEAAAVPVGGLEALHFVRQGHIENGHNVLINGACGTIGTFAIQLARHFGAEVTAVDSTEKLDVLRAIGADKVMDYMREDFTRSGETYDFILDLVGKSSFSRSVQALNRNGRYLIANPGPLQMIRGRWVSMTSSKKVMFGAVSPNPEDLDFLKGLIKAGKLKSVIDRTFSLEQAVEAHRYVEAGQKKGQVVITVTREPDRTER